MKKIFYAIAILATVVSAVSCKKDPGASGKTLNIEPTIKAYTKVSGNSFIPGDEVSINLLSGEKIYASNAKLTCTETGWVGDKNIKWYSETSPITLVAYYPYKDDAAYNELAVAEEQTTEEAIAASSILAALYGPVAPTDNAVPVVMEHLTSKIIVSIKNNSGKDIKSLLLSNVSVSGSIDLENIFENPVSLNKGTVLCAKSDNNFQAIVLPENDKVNVGFDVAYTDGSKVSTVEELPIIMGKQTSLEITVNVEGIVISSNTEIADWEDNGSFEFLDPKDCVLPCEITARFGAPSEYAPEYSEEYPDDSNLYFSVEVEKFGKGYYGIWYARAWDIETELCDLETAWASLELYGDEIEDEFAEGLATENFYEYILSGADPSTEFIFIVAIENKYGERDYKYLLYTTPDGGPDSGPDATSLTGDVDVTLTHGNVYYYGDYFDIECNNSVVQLFNEDETEVVCFDIIYEGDSFAGEYTITKTYEDDLVPYTSAAGQISNRSFYPCYYVHVNDEGYVIKPYAIIVDGTFTFTDGTDENTCILSGELLDKIGNKVKIDNCEISYNFEDYRSPAASPKKDACCAKKSNTKVNILKTK